MGILFILAFYAVVGSVTALLGALIMRSLVTRLVPATNSEPLQSTRERLIKRSTFFPVICVAWAALLFVFQAVINANYLHRDIGLGDSAYTPLPNGYAILLIDKNDQGIVYNPMTQPGERNIGDRSDAVSGVVQLQIAGPSILGVREKHPSGHAADQTAGKSYFILSTVSGTHTDVESEAALRQEASRLETTLELEPIFNIYSQYRFTWFDRFAGLLLIVPIVLGAVLLLRQAIRLRRTITS